MANNPFQIPLQRLMLTIERLKPALVDAIGVEALRFIDDNFAREGFQGATFNPWEKRKKEGKRSGRGILIDTSALRRSFKQTNHDNYTTISSDIPYAQVHNEGGEIHHATRGVILNFRQARGGKLKLTKVQTEMQQRRVSTIRRATVGDHTTKMPKREFAGESPVLSRMCEKAIITIVKPALNTI